LSLAFKLIFADFLIFVAFCDPVIMQASSLLAPKTKSKKSILEQPLPKGKAEVALSAFGYLFMEVLPLFTLNVVFLK
jgi:hypothetical protein